MHRRRTLDSRHRKLRFRTNQHTPPLTHQFKLTVPFSADSSAGVTHEDEVVRGSSLRPVARPLPRRSTRVRGLVNRDVMQGHRSTEHRSHLLVERREGTADLLRGGDARWVGRTCRP